MLRSKSYRLQTSAGGHFLNALMILSFSSFVNLRLRLSILLTLLVLLIVAQSLDIAVCSRSVEMHLFKTEKSVFMGKGNAHVLDQL